MKSFRGFAQQEVPSGSPISTRSLAQKYSLVPPISLQTLLTPPSLFTAPIVTGGLAALGGSVTITINRDGSVRWQGHAHDSGADGYDFGITALVRTPSGRAIALAHTGSVGGTRIKGE
jgi:hypothetical protein